MVEPTNQGPYPLVAYRYQVKVGGSEFFCSEVSNIAVEWEKIEYEHGMSHTKDGNRIYYHGKSSLVEITLQRAIMATDLDLYKWLAEKREDKRDMTVALVDDDGKPEYTWNIIGAMPTKLSAPSFTASGSDVAIESIDLTARKVEIK